ncbi:hypothetical protein F4819DRAFT_488144 [Hypoxylon fuscum]|nr:hypothetical protein F4819DRAFT_488144 [Hypoxylon fuscum]
MLFKTSIIAAFALQFANQAMGVAIDDRAALVATDAYSACNCPNNCEKKAGDKCKFYSGPSDESKKTSGKCYKPNGNPLASIQCIGTA